MESSMASIKPEYLSREDEKQTFPFFELPAEIRLKIYGFLLVKLAVVDLDPDNYRTIRPSLSCFLVSRRMHEEAYHVFYGSPQQAMRLFPTNGRFFHTKRPLLARLGAQYRRAVNTIELMIGPGWTAPPRCWHTEDTLGLKDCHSLRTLKILVACDPSDEFFDGFRGKGNDKDTYKNFCVRILQGMFAQVPTLETVELDGYPGVSKDAPLVRGLVAEIARAKKRIAWGPMRGWEADEGAERRGSLTLDQALAILHI
ncbi:hypothetical protein MBLNU459_g6403t1 [Dothideomycetes sp. NU459]